MARQRLRCLIIEKHATETGGHRHQLQIPLADARGFFGPDDQDLDITLRVFSPPDSDTPLYELQVTVSHLYQQGATRRINRFRGIGQIPTCFMFFQQTADPLVFDFWWDPDKAIIAAKFDDWHQAQSSQHGRGRLVKVVQSPVEKWFQRIE